MKEMFITTLSLAHLEQLYDLEQLCFVAPWSRDSYQREFSENNLAHYFGVWQEQRLLAFGGFWQILDEGHITNVAVHPGCRRLGLAQLLIAHMRAACLTLGGSTMTLEVRESNIAARRLYEKMGFATAGIRPHYYENGENAVIMWSRI